MKPEYELLINRYPALSPCMPAIEAAHELLSNCYWAGGKLLLCGNGGSCADCEHIAGELMKGFLSKRPLTKEDRMAIQEASPEISEETLSRLQKGLPAIPLTSFSALNTAFSNDVDPDLVFAQSVFALGREGDVLLCLSTSGNSRNTVRAAEIARGLGLSVIAMTGAGGGALASLADACIAVPETETYRVQELHLPVYHALCAALEDEFFG